jgi:hypothetical protein
MTSGASATSSIASRKAIGLTRGPSHVDVDIAADCPARLLQTLQKRGDAALALRIIRGQVHEHADAPHPPRLLLRARRQRPRDRRAAEKRDEVAPLHVLPFRGSHPTTSL